MFSYLDKPLIEWTIKDVFKLNLTILIVGVSLSIILFTIIKFIDKRRKR